MGKEELVRKLNSEKRSIREILKKVDLSLSSVRKIVYAQRGGYDSAREHLDDIARKNGQGSRYKYRAVHYEKKAEESLITRILGYYIVTELEKQDKNQKWLANKVGLSKVSISRYCRGQSLPNEDNTKKIFNALESPYEDLTTLVIDNVGAYKKSLLEKKAVTLYI